MSDESGQDEQEQPEEQAPKWGDPISPERQAELQGYLDWWQAENDHGKRRGPFDRVKLTGADANWLADQSEHDEHKAVPNLHLEGALLNYAELQRANFDNAHLECASFLGANLKDAYLGEAQMTDIELGNAHLQRAYLVSAQLSGAILIGVDAEGARFEGANLERVDLRWAHLERTNLTGARLVRADIRAASFDKASRLNDAILTDASLDQVTLDNTNLTVVDWSIVTTLGDEILARTPEFETDEYPYKTGETKSAIVRLNEYRAAVRANRILAVALRNQGLNEDADRFAYRAQFLQQQVLWLQRKVGSYIFSRLLDGVAGYGYRPVRGLIAYVFAILGFAVAYYVLGRTSGVIPGPIDAVVFSLTSFHGRGFFPSENISLHSPVIVLAAAEAIIGLLIEISFIATFTQRFFGR